MAGEILDGVLYGADHVVRTFVAARVPGEPDFGAGTALGVVRRGKLVAGVVYHSYRGHDIEVSCAADDPRWAARRALRRLFSYPFRQLGCARITALTGDANLRTQRFLEGLGFRREGFHPLALDGREDLVSYGMRSDDCRWLKD